jgi:phenylacetate-CoA ligase
MPFYDRTLETLDRARLASHQEQKLVALASVLVGNPFYQAKLASVGLKAADLCTLDALSKVSLTTKREISTAQAEHPPFGGLLSFPRERYRHVHRTSGTTGRPLFWLDTDDDWATWRRGWSMVYRGAGVGAKDVVFCAFSFGPYIAHWTAMAGVEGVGALAVAGGGMRTTERLRMMLDLEATGLVSTPTYALRMAEVAAQEGIDVAAGPLRVTIHAGEPGASLPHVRERLQKLWGAVSYDHAGATEIGAWSFPCATQALHLNELDFLFEVLDPASGEAVPDGQRGELVITTLGRLGMPVLRYRTGDLVVRDSSPCSCGRTLARLVGGVLGRVDDMVVVRGVNVYPSAIDNLVRASPEVLEYQLKILRDPDRMLLAVEVEAPGDPAAVCAALVARFRTQLDLAVEVRSVGRDSLPRFEAKAKRVHVI